MLQLECCFEEARNVYGEECLKRWIYGCVKMSNSDAAGVPGRRV